MPTTASAATTDTIASSFLRALNAPDTPAMRTAVRAWLIKEGITSIKRNNPWNLHGGAPCLSGTGYCSGGTGLPGGVGRVNVGPGDQNVVVFASLDAGVQASANNLLKPGSPSYRYGAVVAGAQSGVPEKFLNALALSSWSEGRYGTKNGGPNSLITIYNGLAKTQLSPYSYRSFLSGVPLPGRKVIGGALGPSTDAPSLLGAWGNVVNYPEGHILTSQDVTDILNKLETAGFFPGANVGNPVSIAARDVTATVLKSHIGQPWNKALEVTLQGELGAAANNATTGIPGAAALQGIADFLGKLSDPARWLYFLALLAGGAMFAFGGVNVLRAAA